MVVVLFYTDALSFLFVIDLGFVSVNQSFASVVLYIHACTHSRDDGSAYFWLDHFIMLSIIRSLSDKFPILRLWL